MNQNTFLSPISPNDMELLLNRYQLKRLIAQGGMGEIFLAEDVLLAGVPVAVKFLSSTFFDPKQLQNFVSEARICAALSQKSLHIVKVTDFGVSESGKFFYVMEYLQGKSLQDLMPMSLSKFINLARQICLGLQCAHQGIKIDGKIYPLIHRDIKPANILVIPDRILGQLVKILDFGVAKFLNTAATLATVDGFNGSLPYSSPEQFKDEELDNCSDIYSLGIIMYEMLAGEKPWKLANDNFGAWYQAHLFEKPQTLTNVNSQLQLPPELEDLVMSCLAKSKSDRPQSLTEILNILENLKLEATDNLNRPVSIAERSTSSNPTEKYQSTNKDTNKSTNKSTKKSSSIIHSNSGLNSSVEKACWGLIWNKDKPIQEIVFPRLVDFDQGCVTALLLMMSQKDIKSRLHSSCYNQFVFVISPHPMLLWLTVLYQPELGAKWLPSYLDMHNREHRLLVNSLIQNKRYPLVLFSLEAPHSCTHITSAAINSEKQQLLKTCLSESKNVPNSNQAQVSKQILKQQYKQMQSQILQYLESSQYSSEQLTSHLYFDTSTRSNEHIG